MIVIAYCFESLSGFSKENGNQEILGILLNRGDKGKSLWKPRRLEMVRNNTREVGFVHTERTSEILRRAPWVFG